METEKETLIRKFNQGQLSDKELLHLENLIIDEQINVQELETFAMFNEISEYGQYNLDSIDNTFYEMLAEQIDGQKIKEKKLNWFKYVPNPIKFAFPAFLLITGIFVGKTWKTGITQSSIDNRIDLQETGSALISQILYAPSVIQKIQVMNQFDHYSKEDQKINILFFALNNDESNIIRIEAIDMILKYSNSEEIRARLISAIREQKSPFVIQYLSKVLQEIGVGISLEKFRTLYNDEIPSEALEIMETNLHIL